MNYRTKQTTIIQKKNKCEEVLRNFAFMKEKDLLTLLDTSKQGISIATAKEKLETIGNNVITTDKEKSVFKRMMEG